MTLPAGTVSSGARPRAARQTPSQSLWKEALAGGAAAVSAVCFTHPLDSIKVRALLHGEQQRHSAPTRTVWKHAALQSRPSIRPLYNGLTAAVCRHAVFSTARFGAYDTYKRYLQRRSDRGGSLSFARRLAATSLAGATAAAVGSPLDAVLVRMQADARLPAAQRRNYRNVAHALAQTARHDGVRRGVYAGARPFIVRSSLVTAAQFSTYEHAKETIASLSVVSASVNDSRVHVASGLVAGVCAAVVSTPLDTIKSRMMNARADGSQHGSTVPVRYTSAWDCARQTFLVEGPRGFFKGFGPCLVRMVPQVMLMWLFAERYRQIARSL